MGSGCSSPLKRLGGKRGKQRRESSTYEVNGDKNANDNLEGDNSAQGRDGQVTSQQPGSGQKYKFVIENEITVQSEINEDHQSTASYYTDGRNQLDDFRPGSENSGAKRANDGSSLATMSTIQLQQSPATQTSASAKTNAAAKVMGLYGSPYAPIDRHLLVSPALSPAPSICHSPSPANSSSHARCATILDLHELSEAFATLTFGASLNNNTYQDSKTTTSLRSSKNYTPDIKQQQSELSGNYTQQLVQTQNDLINCMSVVFITTDASSFKFVSPQQPTSASLSSQGPPPATLSEAQSDLIESSIASKIESSLKSFCDEQSFSLRFLNVSHEHLNKTFHVNNLIDVSMKLLETEYQDDGQRLMIIILSNSWSPVPLAGVGTSDSLTPATASASLTRSASSMMSHNHNLAKRQLPTKVDAQLMNKFLNLNLSNSTIDNHDRFRSTLRRWYNQVGGTFFLNPIYLVDKNILSESNDEREAAWQSWLRDSAYLKNTITQIQENSELTINSNFNEFQLRFLSDSPVEFIISEPSLQKRTLLIRNYSLPTNAGDSRSSSNQQSKQQQTPPQPTSIQQQPSLKHHSKDPYLNDLSRLLADPNKLTLKRAMSEDELFKSISDWILENASKFLENIRENQIIQGKHVPPFIERNLFIELTYQRMKLEYYFGNITENFESKCCTFYNNQISTILSGFTTGATSQISSPDVSNSTETGTTASEAITTNTTSSASQYPESKLPLSANHLVFLSGPRGCGKSTLFAQLVRLAAKELCNKAQIIYRFCGISIDSLSPNRLLRSICEQFCQTQGENVTAASYIYSAQRSEIINALNKIIRVQNTLIFLDGIDKFEADSASTRSQSISNIDWLCELEANPRIKIFVMLETGSELYKKVLNYYSDATYISLDYPSINEWAQMLTITARSKRFSSAGNLYEGLKNLDPKGGSGEASAQETANFTYKSVSDIISMVQIRKLNNESTFPELSTRSIQAGESISNYRNIQSVIITHLQYLLSPYQLCAFFVAVLSSRNGLCESDIINIMTMISQLSNKNNSPATANGESKFSSTLFNYFKIQLKPWIIYIQTDKVVKITLERTFLKQAVDHYTSSWYPNIVGEMRDLLIEYFSHQLKPSKSFILSAIKLTSDGGPAIEPKENISKAECLWLATKASETLHLLILTNPSKAREYILSKHQFFIQFLYGSMPEEFIEDFERLKDVTGRKPSYGEELQCLVDYIRQSVYPLRYDGSQIYGQIYCRTYETSKTGKFPKSKKFSDILAIASNPPIRNLLPISEASVNSFIKTRIGPSQPAQGSLSSSSAVDAAQSVDQATKTSSTSSYQQSGSTGGAPNQPPAKQKIYNIKDNHRHVIVIHPDKGCLQVWDIYEERAVRTINNLDQPKDLRMIDQKRAVILCNRELRVYDLDSGCMLTKLKGVMNQKMPFFEAFGDNYVVALARNRMYVNMLNLNTGELETTFKVGEDRFLNSLLVSANGGICVCGDETQKPFPLLVWNLNERRLMHDLRLERHEFITRLSAISDDGHFVVSVCKQLGDSNDAAGSLQSGMNGSAISGGSASSIGGPISAIGGSKASPNFIVVYDLNSGTLFKKWKPGLDTCAVAISLPPNKTSKVISTIADSSILIWDLSTGSKKHTLMGHTAPADVIRVQNNRLFSMDSTCRDQSLRMWDLEEGYCMAVFSPDAPVNSCQISTRGDALICGFAAETRLSTLVLCKNESVNEVVKRNKRRKSSKSMYVFDEPPGRKPSS